MFFRLSRAESNFSKGCLRPHGHALFMARQSSIGWACGWLVSAVFLSRIKKSFDFPDRFRNEKWNARAHSVGEHVQHFQSPRSYLAHALSSVAKSSLSQLDMGDANSQLAKEGGSFEECDAPKPQFQFSENLISGLVTYKNLVSTETRLRYDYLFCFSLEMQIG